MFDSKLLPAPDEFGTFMHPDIPMNFEEWDDFFPNCSHNIEVVSFVDEQPQYLTKEPINGIRRFKSIDTEEYIKIIKLWKPPVPKGNNWQLIAKITCETGPIAFFAQPK